jgi:FKBP-type peptidyl-prolyl cis-trans isomerase 2
MSHSDADNLNQRVSQRSDYVTQSGSEIVVEYELSTDDELVDQAMSTNPLRLVLGQGGLHPAIEKYFIGRSQGESFEVCLDSSLAFGDANPQLRFQISRKKLPTDIQNISVGASFEAPGPDRTMRVFRIVEADDRKITVDGNHPLSGIPLFLQARIVEILRI